VKFLADMGIPMSSVAHLRRAGYDVTHLREQGLQRLSDPEILEKARDEGRVLLTHDLDFGQLLALSGATSPSVIVFRLADMRPGSVSRHLDRVLQQVMEDLARGAIVSVREGRIRVRSLPI
jgi:predicted nuclease of predicted toxin-antitoxin system